MSDRARLDRIEALGNGADGLGPAVFLSEGQQMSDRVRIGIVGLGRLGRRHAENLAFRAPGAELVAAASPARRGTRLGGEGAERSYRPTAA